MNGVSRGVDRTENRDRVRERARTVLRDEEPPARHRRMAQREQRSGSRQGKRRVISQLACKAISPRWALSHGSGSPVAVPCPPVHAGKMHRRESRKR